MSVLHEITHRCDFVVLDFVLDLIDGQALDEPDTWKILAELQAKMRSWNDLQVDQTALRLVYLAIVPSMGMGICIVAGNGARSSIESEIFQTDLSELIGYPCPHCSAGDQRLNLLFPWILERYLIGLGLMLAPMVSHSLAGGARDSVAEMAKHVLPRGVKRKRQIKEVVLTGHGLCEEWASYTWRDEVLYVASSRPEPSREQLTSLFALVDAIALCERPVTRLGSQTIVLGLRASGPSGLSAAAQRQAAHVRKLNILLREQVKAGSWTSIAIVKHGDIPDHIDSLDESLAFMLSRVAARTRDAHCLLCLRSAAIELPTAHRWCAFDPLQTHSVKATPGTLSIVLYSAKRGVRQQDHDLMRELGFPGWTAGEDETELETLSSSSVGAEAQTFTHAPTVSLDPISEVPPPSATPPLVTMRHRQTQLEISPTLPFTGGWHQVKLPALNEHLFDPDLVGECVFQAMLFLGGFATSWSWCTWARGLVSGLWSSNATAPHRRILLSLFTGTNQSRDDWWVDPLTTR
eukprot:6490298-Amphidinium_carterae.1